MNNKIFLAVLAAALVAFFGGWLIFGIIFAEYYMSHANEAAKVLMKAQPEMWAIAIGNIAWALLITCVLQQTGNITFAKGLMTGLWISFLIMLIFDLSMYAFWDIYEIEFIVVDIIVGSVFWAIVGGVAGAVLDSRKKMMATS